MGRMLPLIIVAMISMVVCAADCEAAARSRSGAFITGRADSVAGLVKQISTSPIIGERYARHFGVSQDKLVQYLTTNVKIVSLDKPMKSTTYYLTPSGRVVAKFRTFPKGSKMFVTSDGRALLDASCGNPLVKFLPKLPPRATPEPTSQITPVTKVEAALPQELPPPLPPVAIPPVEAPVAPAVIQPVTTAVAVPAVSISPVAKAAAPLLLGVVALHDSNSVVPEPGTILAACSILAPVVIVFRRRRP